MDEDRLRAYDDYLNCDFWKSCQRNFKCGGRGKSRNTRGISFSTSTRLRSTGRQVCLFTWARQAQQNGGGYGRGCGGGVGGPSMARWTKMHFSRVRPGRVACPCWRRGGWSRSRQRARVYRPVDVRGTIERQTGGHAVRDSWKRRSSAAAGSSPSPASPPR